MATPNSLSGASECDGAKAPEGHSSLATSSSSSRAEISVVMRHGIVAVHRDECGRVEVVRNCQVEGDYRYEGHVLEKGSQDVSYRGRDLHVESVSGGRWRADTSTLTQPKLAGADCTRATHLVTSVNVGAFTLTKPGETEPLQSDGKADSCKDNDSQPSPGCDAPVDVELTPIKRGGSPEKQGIETGIIAPQ